MHSNRTAEWILGLVTSRDRAASTAGDFAEEAAAHGTIWFWSQVLGTAASLLWRGVAENPWRVIRVALLGFAVDVGASALLGSLSGVAFFVAAFSGHPAQVNSIWWTIGLHAPMLVASLLVGRILARRAPGAELGACLAYAILGSISSVVVTVVSPGGLGFSALLWVFLSDAAQRTPVVAGAVWGRHRRLASRYSEFRLLDGINTSKL